MAANHLIDWTDAFLAALREYPVVQHACDAVGVNRSLVYRRREAEPAFAKAWEEAMEAGIDRAEQEAFRRGVVGFEEPVVHKGFLSYRLKHNADGSLMRNEDGLPVYETDANGQPIPLTIRKHSDALLALVLKGRRKQVYAERTELTSPDGSMSPVADDATRAARTAQLLALAQQRKAAEQAAEDFGDLA